MGFLKKLKKAVKKGLKTVGKVVDQVESAIKKIPVVGEPLAKVLPYVAPIPGLAGVAQVANQAVKIARDPVGFAVGGLQAYMGVASGGISMIGQTPAPRGIVQQTGVNPWATATGNFSGRLTPTSAPAAFFSRQRPVYSTTPQAGWRPSGRVPSWTTGRRGRLQVTPISWAPSWDPRKVYYKGAYQ